MRGRTLRLALLRFLIKTLYKTADKVGSTAGIPRITSRQQHRSNAAATTPCKYFEINVAIPFLDHIIGFIGQQFSKSSTTAIKLLGLVPSIVCTKAIDIDDAIIEYGTDLSSPELIQMELKRWKNRYFAIKENERPSSAAGTIKECDRDMFPNLYIILLQIACTIPATSCECERSASGLRKLNNYMRSRPASIMLA